MRVADNFKMHIKCCWSFRGHHCILYALLAPDVQVTNLLQNTFVNCVQPEVLFALVQDPVSMRCVPDYHDFVKEEDAIWLNKIKSKVNRSQYTSLEAFLADFRQLTANCLAYNSDENAAHGRFAAPGQFIP